ncbi:hypothetical protein FVW27_05825 [Desulfovibrio sp. XJ01]|nr:hypothetical protein [Nitratidesulfovibrio liaohensis]
MLLAESVFLRRAASDLSFCAHVHKYAPRKKSNLPCPAQETVIPCILPAPASRAAKPARQTGKNATPFH